MPFTLADALSSKVHLCGPATTLDAPCPDFLELKGADLDGKSCHALNQPAGLQGIFPDAGLSVDLYMDAGCKYLRQKNVMCPGLGAIALGIGNHAILGNKMVWATTRLVNRDSLGKIPVTKECEFK